MMIATTTRQSPAQARHDATNSSSPMFIHFVGKQAAVTTTVVVLATRTSKVSTLVAVAHGMRPKAKCHEPQSSCPSIWGVAHSLHFITVNGVGERTWIHVDGRLESPDWGGSCRRLLAFIFCPRMVAGCHIYPHSSKTSLGIQRDGSIHLYGCSRTP